MWKLLDFAAIRGSVEQNVPWMRKAVRSFHPHVRP
jgi:hypothetical protein